MNATDELVQSLVIDQAAEWHARRRAGDLTAAENEEFMAWLQSSPTHVREYLAAAAVSRHFPAAIEQLGADRHSLYEQACNWLRANRNVVRLRSIGSAGSMTNAIPEMPVRSRRTILAAAVSIALVFGGAIYWGLAAPGLSGWPRALEVPRGEQRTVQLYDGSVVHMNADTRMRVRYSRTRRLIELEHGQALFNVVGEKARPFVVRAGGAEVVAIGTQFDVAKRATLDAITVTVIEGKVAVFEHGPVSRTVQQSRTTVPLQLTAGQRLRLDPTHVQRRAEPVDSRVATAWLRRELIFTEERLADVAEEFSRYGVPIEIEDAALRDYRISGVFSAYDTESFVAFLRRFGEVEQAGQGIRVHGARLPPKE